MSEEEQVRALQEKLKNMSPEELQAFWKERCVFCQIIGGNVDSKKIYEDKFCVAVLDINPATPGHILLLPKDHYTVGPQVPEKVMTHLGMVTKALSHACLRVLKCKGTSVFMANGAAAGQQAQHFIVHVIPQYEKPTFALPGHGINPEELAQLSSQLAAYISKKLGTEMPKEAPPEPVVEEKSTPQEPVKKQPEKQEIKEEPLEREDGYLYFLDKELNIKRVKAGQKNPKKELVKKNKTKKVTKGSEEQKKKESTPSKKADLDTIGRLFG